MISNFAVGGLRQTHEKFGLEVPKGKWLLYALTEMSLCGRFSPEIIAYDLVAALSMALITASTCYGYIGRGLGR
jgi:hypothetical protein